MSSTKNFSNSVSVSVSRALLLIAGFSPALGSAAGVSIPALSNSNMAVNLQAKALFQNGTVKSLLTNVSHKLEFDRVVTLDGLQTVQFKHLYKGLEVIGSVAKQHDSADFKALSVNATMAFDLDTVPSVTAESVALRANNFAKNVSLLSAPDLRVLPGVQENTARLVYWTPVQTSTGRHTMVFDAHSGHLIADLPSRISALAPVTVVSAHKIPASQIDPQSGMPNELDPKYLTIMVKDSTVLPAADDSAKRALKAIAKTLKYYKEKHGRDSYDGQGSRVAAIVHLGRNFANAFWTGEGNFMAYGDGNKKYGMGDMTLGNDVTGHELTHGVVDNSIKVGDVQGLLYFRDSGALNEAIADFLGELSQGNPDWIMGKELFLDPEVGANGIRNLTDPSKNKEVFLIESGPKAGELEERVGPSLMSEKFEVAAGNGDECVDYNDNCYVHANSTIPSHTLYLVLQELGQAKTEKLVYHTLTHFLSPTATFEEFREGVEKSCDALKFSKTECKTVSEVFEARGFKLPAPPAPPNGGGHSLVWNH